MNRRVPVSLFSLLALGGPVSCSGGGGDGATELSLTAFPVSMKSYSGGGALLLAEVVAVPSSVSVEFAAQAEPTAPVALFPSDSEGPGVREILLWPEAEHVDGTLSIHLTAASGDLEREATANVEVISWEATPDPTAAQVRNQFSAWLASNRPEFGITGSTTWQDLGTAAQVIIVTHQLYLSDEWEMEVMWHNMIAPDDWAEAYLRKRSELKPSWAARIASLTTDPTISETTPPETVFRAP